MIMMSKLTLKPKNLLDVTFDEWFFSSNLLNRFSVCLTEDFKPLLESEITADDPDKNPVAEIGLELNEEEQTQAKDIEPQNETNQTKLVAFVALVSDNDESN